MATMTITNPATATSGVRGTAGLAHYFQPVLQKKLINRLKETLKLADLAMQVDLPKNSGTDKVKFFQFKNNADAAEVRTLTEGTAPAQRREVDLRSIEVQLTQFGEILQITDKLSYLTLFNVLSEGIALLGEDAALKCDSLVRDAFSTGSDIANNATAKRYVNRTAAGTRDHAGVNSATAANSSLNAVELLDAVTALKNNKANPLKGSYTALVPPQVARDLFRDTDFLNTVAYAGSAKPLVTGELGSFYGVRIVEHTNPFIEGATEGTYSSSGSIYSVPVVGGDSVGVVKLSGDSPLSPKVTVLNTADKSDILNQNIYAGYKLYYTAQLLDARKAVVIKAKSSWASA